MVASRRPVIGIVTRAIDLPQRTDRIQGVFLSYIDCVHVVGGLPLLVPLVSGAAIDLLHGLLLTGGEDLAQASWWSSGNPRGRLDAGRDAAEYALSLNARTKKIPALGICRGAQVLNCALGGLVAGFDDRGEEAHIDTDESGVCEHSVTVESDTVLGSVLGGEKGIRVISRHSSFISKLGKGLRSVAVADDGTVEAFESSEWACVGLQWHPEWHGSTVRRDLRPFEWLVAEARKRMRT